MSSWRHGWQWGSEHVVRTRRRHGGKGLDNGLLLAGLGLAVIANVLVGVARIASAAPVHHTSARSASRARTARNLAAVRPPGAPRGIVGLGDSVPAGTACGCTSYVTLVASSLAGRQHAPVPVTNLASDGQTTSGLLDQLASPATQQVLARAQAAIVTIGANDFDASVVGEQSCSTPGSTACYGDDLSSLGPHLGAVLTQVRRAMPPGGQVLVTGYWNVFLDGRVAAAKGSAYAANSDALTRQVNTIIARAAAAAGARYVDLYALFKGNGSADDTSLLADDGDHPNAAGHEVIAAALLQALR